jgi:hypothetical protein
MCCWLVQDPAQDNPTSTWARCHNQELLGLMNITTPQAAGLEGNANSSGPYVFVSMPMFCGADERLAADSRLVCDEERHQTFIDVEPITGEPRLWRLAAALDVARVVSALHGFVKSCWHSVWHWGCGA